METLTSGMKCFFAARVISLCMKQRTCQTLLQTAAALFALSANAIASAAPVEAVPIARDLYRLSGTMANCVFLTGSDGVLLVDSAESADLAQAMRSAIATATDKPVEYLVNTHSHFDHTNGNRVFAAENAGIIAQSSAREELVKAVELPPEALPQICFDDDLTLFFDDDVVYLLHPNTRGAHTSGDIVVFFSRRNVLATGDLFFNGTYPYIDTARGGWAEGMAASIREALRLINDKTIVVPGHGPLSDRSGLADYAAMLEDVDAKVRAMADAGMSLEKIQKAGPTAAWDARYGHGFVPPEKFVEMVYEGIATHR
jgi:cyclase